MPLATAKKEAAFWKRHEIIRISTALIVWGFPATREKTPVLLYYIRFSTE